MMYFLSNRKFTMEIDACGIGSITSPTDTLKTQFVREGARYCSPVIVYQSGEKLHTLDVSDLEATAEFGHGNKSSELFFPPDDDIGALPPVCRKMPDIPFADDLKRHFVFFHYKDSNERLALSARYILRDDAMQYELCLKNICGDSIEIMDVSMCLPTNTHFQWGVPGEDKVIPHLFIGGNGSYVYMKRTDGQAPFLLLQPQGDLAFEYVESKENFAGVAHEGHNNIFFYSKNAGGKARALGSNLRHDNHSLTLAAGEEKTLAIRFSWAYSEQEIRDSLCEHGGVDVRSIPGYTIPRDLDATLCIRGQYDDMRVEAEFPEKTEIVLIREEKECAFYRIKFHKLGENKIILTYGDGKWTNLQYFSTEPIATLLAKRSKFLEATQCKDRSKWYYGLLCEWNNRTNIPVTPDNYDDIKGWRIYEPASDDAAYGKAAFLASKLSVYPVQSEVDAMDDYIEHFVWGGLQMTEEEEYPYAIYGTPDWHANRESDDFGVGRTSRPAQLHFWRIYDYPHIFVMYFNMYKVARDYPGIATRLDKDEYLKRAYKTAQAMYVYPYEVDSWSADYTGLMNEMIIPDIIQALRETDKLRWAQRLEFHWLRKMRRFVVESTEIFGSEYPFDTTGFETTHRLAKGAFEIAADYGESTHMRRKTITRPDAIAFMERSINANFSCRGTIEPAFFWFGSDYKRRNTGAQLQYMAQMGGWAILDYALYYADDPFEFLRVGYGAMLSSWALVNTGDAESNYGYWFPGKALDGAVGGVYEPLPFGKTWLGQEHRGGVWYYSGEADGGFCAGIRGLATILADDPIFGLTALGGTLRFDGGAYSISAHDGINQRFHIITRDLRVHFVLEQGAIAEPIFVSKGYGEITVPVDTSAHRGVALTFHAGAQFTAAYDVLVDGAAQPASENGTYSLAVCKDAYTISLRRR